MRDDPLAHIQDWQTKGYKTALATVVSTWGSSPRQVGSHLAVREDGVFVGSVSGGCVEGAVVLAAQEAMEKRSTKLLHFGVSNDQAWEVGLACGGSIEVFVEPC